MKKQLVLNPLPGHPSSLLEFLVTHPIGSEVPTIRLRTYKLCIDWSVLFAIWKCIYNRIMWCIMVQTHCNTEKQYVGYDGLFAIIIT